MYVGQTGLLSMHTVMGVVLNILQPALDNALIMILDIPFLSQQETTHASYNLRFCHFTLILRNVALLR